MAAFRRCVIALAVLVVFSGLAFAQSNVAMSCTLNFFPNTTRNEGGAEQVGDMTIFCTGGSAITDGTAIPQVNFTVQLSQPITSRIVSGTTVSDALLLVDEPGSGGGPVPLFGPNQAATVCATPTTGCSPSFKATASSTPVMSGSSTSASATAPNTFQGIVSGNSVTFFGVPILAPVSAGVSRIFRITNVRGNMTAGTPGTNVVASLTFSGTNTTTNVSTLLQLPQNSGTVSIIQSGLNQSATGTRVTNNASTVATGAGSLPVCQTQGTTTTLRPQFISTLNFVEGFGNAFKTRQTPNATALSAQSNLTTLQNVPGSAFGASESGLTITGITATTPTTAGLADFGTRLKATFANVPAGVRLFVSLNNVVANVVTITAAGSIGTNLTTSFAQLLATTSAENVSDGSSGPTVATASSTSGLTVAGAADSIPTVELTVTGGAATAVWEVFNDNPTANETFSFNVYVIYTANVPPVTGSTGTVPTPTVNLTYAPTGTAGAGVIPNFTDIAQSPKAVFNLTNCKTVLLFPYVTSNGGLDTGLAISNTSSDPLGTSLQAGNCALNWYSTNTASQTTATTVAGTAVAAFTTPVVVAGTTWVDLASIRAPSFTGYMIAVCNFQYAHGFAFIAVWGNATTSSAMGYLAEVLPTTRVTGTESLGF